jgi:isopentenyl diphosphate isomerase/L-lactate dehydrogenase-like FMN-dependent dehydrogenase
MPDPDKREISLPSLFFSDLRALAQRALGQTVFDYIDSAAGEERSSMRNEADLAAIQFRPLSLRDVRSPKLATSLLGCEIDAPIGFSPTAFHKLVHPDGEIATARAARDLRMPMIVSSMSSVSLEDVANSSKGAQLWLQTYLFSDRRVTQDLVRRAKDANYKAVVLTIGCPVAGIRDRNIRNRFTLPEQATAANFRRKETTVHNNPIHSFQGAELDPGATWKDVEWLRKETDLPIVLKGLMNPADVKPAIESGASGIVVSNHGGRQLDGTESTIAALPDIVSAVDGRIPVLIDSGYRRGVDIAKALALGADAVFLGRPVMWALAAGGAPGVFAAMKNLAEELKTTMQLLGCGSLADLRMNASCLLRLEPSSHHARLREIPL